MTTQTEALKLALEALEVVYVNQPSNHFAKTIAGVKKALSDTNNKQVSWPISGDAAKQIADKLCVSYEVVQLVAREITAIKEALAQPEQTNTRPYYTIDELNAWADEKEKQAWRNAAIRIGEELSSVGPEGYYNMNAWQWLDWAMENVKKAQPEKTVCPFCSSEWVTAEQHDRKMDRLEQEPVELVKQFSLLLWDYQELERAFEKATGGKWVRKSNTPQRTWVGLTPEERDNFWKADQMTSKEWEELFDAIESKLKEKNT